MSEEEKKAIHRLKFIKWQFEQIPEHTTTETHLVDRQAIDVVLDLIFKQEYDLDEADALIKNYEEKIKKQQEEIKDLKLKNNTIYKWNEFLDKQCISKDKIRDLIENNEQDIDYSVHDIIDDLRKLLGE